MLSQIFSMDFQFLSIWAVKAIRIFFFNFAKGNLFKYFHGQNKFNFRQQGMMYLGTYSVLDWRRNLFINIIMTHYQPFKMRRNEVTIAYKFEHEVPLTGNGDVS